MPRMFLIQPKRDYDPGRHYWYTADGLLDLDADIRCATCAKWGGESTDDQGGCGWLAIKTWGDFGCVEWEAK